MEERPRLRLVERVVVKKYQGDWTDEQKDSGEADHALLEVVTLENGEVIDHWRRSDGTDYRGT